MGDSLRHGWRQRQLADAKNCPGSALNRSSGASVRETGKTTTQTSKGDREGSRARGSWALSPSGCKHPASCTRGVLGWWRMPKSRQAGQEFCIQEPAACASRACRWLAACANGSSKLLKEHAPLARQKSCQSSSSGVSLSSLTAISSQRLQRRPGGLRWAWRPSTAHCLLLCSSLMAKRSPTSLQK